MGRLLVYVFDLIFITVIGWVVGRIFQQLTGRAGSFSGRPQNAPPRDARPLVRGETARDPVCGMFVSKEVSHQLRRGSETLHFCSQECLKRYQSEARNS